MYLYSIIDNTIILNAFPTIPFSFLVETFGDCGRPKVAFQADTFGHSREQALLSSLMVRNITINMILIRHLLK